MYLKLTAKGGVAGDKYVVLRCRIRMLATSKAQSNGSELGTVLSLREHLSMSRDSFGFHN